MSDALPQFDAESRTLKTRFELDNPGHLLQADMFVDVEIAVAMPPAVTVPADAVFDSGVRKTVFVDRGQGNFEARRVETGWRVGDRVEIVKGLMEGERIVAAATFLLDSESRMKAASQGGLGSPTEDPICGMAVDEARAAAAGRTVEHGGRTYSFCSDECKRKFQAAGGGGAQPAKTAMPPAARALAPATEARHAPAPSAPDTDPVCGMKVDLAEAKAAGLTSQHRGRMVPFCNESCRKAFDADPAKYEAQRGAAFEDGQGHTHGDATAHAQAPSGRGN
jgi:YHS domain-containing protein